MSKVQFDNLIAYYFDDSNLYNYVTHAPYTRPISFLLSCWEEEYPYEGCKMIDALSDGENYGVRWFGKLLVPVSGQYTFTLNRVDDAARVFLDGALVVDTSWNWPAPDQRPSPQSLSLTGGWHDVVIEYRQFIYYEASLSIRWAGPGFGEEVIPVLAPKEPPPEDQDRSECECPLSCSTQDQGWAGGPINTRTGNYHYSTTDISIPTAGHPLRFERSYNSWAVISDSQRLPALGYGWTHNYEMGLIFSADPGGEPGTVIVRGCRGSRFRFLDNGDGTFTPLPGIWATLTRTAGSPATYVLTGVDQSVYIFDETGRLIEIRDPRGHPIQLIYDESGRLVRAQDATGLRFLEFSYNDQDLLSEVRDPLGRTVRYNYGDERTLVAVTDTRGIVWTYQYSAHLYLPGSGTELPLLTDLYDPTGRLIERVAYDFTFR